MKKLEVKGMSCQHCVASVTDALKKFPHLKDIKVDLEEGMAHFETESPISDEDVEHLKKAIEKIGFEPGEYREQ